MIPEKWDRIYLYASVIERPNKLQTGEMYFYYFPKGVFKKNPVNVYEVPNRFNIEEEAYMRLADDLYGTIKKLREELISAGQRPWTNITISIENFKFKVEYNYDDLINSVYSNYERHLIWRHCYLDVSINSYSKKERQVIERYLSQSNYINKNISTYTEGIYQKPVKNIIDYNKEDYKKEYKPEKMDEIHKPKEEEEFKSQILTSK